MSKFQKDVSYSKKQLNLQIVNTYVNIHDLNCGCNKPLEHIIEQITTQEPSLKCLTTTGAGDGRTGEEEDEPFGAEDLEALFAEPDTEKDADR